MIWRQVGMRNLLVLLSLEQIDYATLRLPAHRYHLTKVTCVNSLCMRVPGVGV